jgi:hypothetical protein
MLRAKISRETVKKFLPSSPVQGRRVFESRATDVVILWVYPDLLLPSGANNSFFSVIGRPRAGKSSVKTPFAIVEKSELIQLFLLAVYQCLSEWVPRHDESLLHPRRGARMRDY